VKNDKLQKYERYFSTFSIRNILRRFVIMRQTEAGTENRDNGKSNGNKPIIPKNFSAKARKNSLKITESEEEVVGINLTQFISPDNTQRFYECFAKIKHLNSV
jgi:hypothetical protein